MSTQPQALGVANDITIERLVDSAQRRLVIVAPGLSKDVAEAVAEKWRLLGPDAVSVTLDVDPEACRLGYGEIEAVALLQQAAARVGATLNTHPGLRIGVIIADDHTLIYAPTALHIEASPQHRTPREPIKPNAIHVGPPPTGLQMDLGLGVNGAKDQVVGLDPVRRERIEEVQKDLKQLPPQPFDLTRRLRVYTAHIEFVELRLVGCMLERRTIAIPSDLVGLADEQTRKLLESKFRLIAAQDAGVWGQEIRRIKDFIVDRFLVHLPTFGHVVRLRDKPKFELAVHTLERLLNRARARKAAKLQDAINRRVDALHKALLPTVIKNPPQRWRAEPTMSGPAERLREELEELAGNAADMLKAAKVELRYKGVTYDTLVNPIFIETVRAAMPHMENLHDESDAAPAASRFR